MYKLQENVCVIFRPKEVSCESRTRSWWENKIKGINTYFPRRKSIVLTGGDLWTTLLAPLRKRLAIGLSQRILPIEVCAQKCVAEHTRRIIHPINISRSTISIWLAFLALLEKNLVIASPIWRIYYSPFGRVCV